MAALNRPSRLPQRPRPEDQLALVTVNTRDATNVAETAQQSRRKRASKPKVRTGCTTCKIRRVKCDEEKPNCRRCTSTGRKCDGYEYPRTDLPSSSVALTVNPPEAQAPGQQPQLFLPSSISVPFAGTAKERRIFHRFQVRTIPAFAGSSELDFWECLVLKVGQQEPVVRNAIVALATLHEDYQKRNGRYSKDLIEEPSYQHALTLYGKALRQLNERLCEGNRANAKLALISSILFTCFEVLRRNNMAAIIHYQAGMRELTRQIKATREDEASSYESSSAITEFRSIPQDELDVLLRVFARYDIQACTFAKPRAEALVINLPTHPPTEMTLAQVKRDLDNLLISVYQFVKSDLTMYRYWSANTVPTDWLLRRDEAILNFEAWLGAIESFFRRNSNINGNNNSSTTTTATTTILLRPQDQKSLLGLRMQVKIAIIQLKTCISSPAETSFDAFLPEFDDIVTRIEDLADTLSLREAVPLDNESTAFTMELGILHPLFFVAMKCRHAGVRRRAITALKRGGREGVWEGPIVALVMEWVVKIEEVGVKPGEVVPEGNRMHDIKNDVDYERRRVLVEAKRSIDHVEWKRWESVREIIPF